MQAWKATYENDREETTEKLIGAGSLKSAASKAADNECADWGDCIKLEKTDEVIL